MSAGLLSLPAELLCDIIERLLPVHVIFDNSESDISLAYSEIPSAGPFTCEGNLDMEDADLLQTEFISSAYRTLAALARTCRHLNPVAMQFLYTCFHSWYGKPYAGFMRQMRTSNTTSRHIRPILIQKSDHIHEGRSRDEIRSDVLEISAIVHPHLDFLLEHDPSQIEIAILIFKAVNLESMYILNDHSPNHGFVRPPPMWLRLIMDAGRKYLEAPASPHLPVCSRLHTLEIDVQKICSSDLAYIFCLPLLRKLRLDHLDPHQYTAQVAFDWPVPAGSSGVENLVLNLTNSHGDIVARFIASCKALKSLACSCSARWEPLRVWYTKVLGAAHNHCGTLKLLSLNGDDQGVPEDEAQTYPRLGEFSRYHALEYLSVPLLLLTGRPMKAYIGPDDWQHQCLRDLLPPRLLKLDTWARSFRASHLDSILRSVLPLEHAEERRLQRIDFACFQRHNRAMPGLHDIQESLRLGGISFVYDIHVDIERECKFLAQTTTLSHQKLT